MAYSGIPRTWSSVGVCRAFDWTSLEFGFSEDPFFSRVVFPPRGKEPIEVAAPWGFPVFSLFLTVFVYSMIKP